MEKRHKTRRIVRNAILCRHCLSEIVSVDLHDFKFCECGKVGVDGGTEYLGRTGSTNDYLELSEWMEIYPKNHM